MKGWHWFSLGAASTAALAVAVALVVTARYDWHREAHQDEERTHYVGGGPEVSAPGARLALDDALRIATAQVPGEVVKVERERKHGVEILEVKVLTASGRVREIKLGASDGRILEIEDD